MLFMLQHRITQREAARILGVSRQTLNNWLDRGLIPHIQVGGRRFLTQKHIADFVVASARPAAVPPEKET